MKKKIIQLGMILMVCGLLISACQAKSDSSEDVLMETDAYPLPEFIIPPSDEGYPIAEDDLVLLLRTWNLVSRVEDDLNVESGSRSLELFPEKTYKISEGDEVRTGTWAVTLREDNSSVLILDASLRYEILLLNEAFLHLRSVQKDVVIDEHYVATD